jgi:copper(I)-binding protein
MLWLTPLLAMLAAPASAQSAPIVLESAIAMTATEVGEHVGGYVRIRNLAGEADRLVAVSCACSRATEIHSTREGGMTALPALEVPAGGAVEIRPGSGLHLLLEAAGPIPAGSMIELTLRFERAGAITQRFAVVPDTQAAWATTQPSSNSD